MAEKPKEPLYQMTLAILNRGKSSNNGFNKKQLAILGEPDQISGWRQRILSRQYTEKQLKEFFALKDAHFKNGNKLLKAQRRKKKVLEFVYEPPNSISWSNQYLHPNWQRMRLYVLQRDKYTCVDCGEKSKQLHVHHLKYSPSGFIWEVPHWYLVTLCETCHAKEHGKR
jgi:hypothetical protein